MAAHKREMQRGEPEVRVPRLEKDIALLRGRRCSCKPRLDSRQVASEELKRKRIRLSTAQHCVQVAAFAPNPFETRTGRAFDA